MAGYILYRGPSMLDGKPIVVIGLQSSDNRKTGNMAQVYILREDIHPQEAIWAGEDSTICGNCPHRGDGTGKGRSCYVIVFQGPSKVYQAYKAGKYAIGSPKHFRGSVIRFGTYGDPAAVPYEILKQYAEVSAGYTSYTHQWRNCDPQYANICMASCDTEQDRTDAKAMGYRTFRVRSSQDSIGHREFSCPASEEAGKRLQCHECRACSGTRFGKVANAADVTIIVHGNKAITANANRTLTRLTVGGK